MPRDRPIHLQVQDNFAVGLLNQHILRGCAYTQLQKLIIIYLKDRLSYMYLYFSNVLGYIFNATK